MEKITRPDGETSYNTQFDAAPDAVERAKIEDSYYAQLIRTGVGPQAAQQEAREMAAKEMQRRKEEKATSASNVIPFPKHEGSAEKKDAA